MKGMGITHIPNEIDQLIHLRYLDLSWNKDLSELPNSVCGLINLQTLKLKGCSNLVKLPKEMRRMVKLRNLNIRYASGLVYLPKGIKNWKSLRTLSNFIVTDVIDGCKMEELKHQNLLKDYLEIKGLGRLKSEEQAVETKLQAKSQLTDLRFDFDSCEVTLASASTSSEGQIHQQRSGALETEIIMESVLGVLQPHSNVKKLTILNYLGFKFPTWMGEIKALTNLSSLELYKCSNCTELPALGLLPSLEVLVIKHLSNLKRIGVEVYGGGHFLTEMAFPKLITLQIVGTVNLEVWEFGNGEVQVGEMMPRVTSITLFGCRKLIALPALNKLPSLEKLKIEYADQLTSISTEYYCISTMPSCGGIRQLDHVTSFPKLVTLEINVMKNLEVIILVVGEKENSSNEIVIMPCSRSLRITTCPELKSLRFLTKFLPSIERIHMWNLEAFELEEEVKDLSILPCLLDLELWKCPKLISFPSHLPSLSSLIIRGCPSLISDNHRPYLPISPNLRYLYIYEGAYQSLDHLGDIAQFKGLQQLVLRASLDESFKFIPEYVQNLSKLEWLEIYNNSGMHEGGDWSILSHIPYICINKKKVDPLTYSSSSSSNQTSHLQPETN